MSLLGKPEDKKLGPQSALQYLTVELLPIRSTELSTVRQTLLSKVTFKEEIR